MARNRRELFSALNDYKERAYNAQSDLPYVRKEKKVYKEMIERQETTIRDLRAENRILKDFLEGLASQR